MSGVTLINRGATLAVALVILCSFAPAQMNTAQISGVVEDASGAVIPGAARHRRAARDATQIHGVDQ